MSKNFQPGSIRLSAVLKQPFSAYRPGRMDELILGMSNQVSQAMDEAVTSEVKFSVHKCDFFYAVFGI